MRSLLCQNNAEQMENEGAAMINPNQRTACLGTMPSRRPGLRMYLRKASDFQRPNLNVRETAFGCKGSRSNAKTVAFILSRIKCEKLRLGIQ